MPDEFADLDILFLQSREIDAVAEHERYCLIDLCGLQEEQVDAVNVPREGFVEWERIEQAGAVIVGGSGEFSASQLTLHDWTERLLDTIRRIVDAGKPMFGISYGQHAIARALGGEVVTDASRRETGVRPITLTPAGHDDPVLGRCPKTFHALLAHNDHVLNLPDSCVSLASSDICTHQAFKVVDRPVYGTLFHVELTPRTLLERLQRYRAAYCPDQDEFERLVASLRPTPDAENILKRFLETYAARVA
ncbi:MAG: glutamine amidotransferase [Planctomycetota bacterium]